MPLAQTTGVPLTRSPVDVVAHLATLQAGERIRVQNGGGAVIRHGEFGSDPGAAETSAHALDPGDSVGYSVVAGRSLWAWSVRSQGLLIVSQEQ